MPKYRATLVRVEKYVEEIELEAPHKAAAWGLAATELENGVEFDGEVVDGDEYVDTVEEISNE